MNIRAVYIINKYGGVGVAALLHGIIDYVVVVLTIPQMVISSIQSLINWDSISIM